VSATDAGTEFLVPAHPTVRDWPAALTARWLDPDDDRWLDGPWKSLAKVARDGHWVVKAFVARGFIPTAAGKLGALTDTLSLRCWRAHPSGEFDRAVALWSRATWPVLGRGRKAAEDEAEGRQGEGRATSEGKTWLWHPPMVPPEVTVIPWHPPMKTPAKDTVKDPLLTKWTFTAAWKWTTGGVNPVVMVSSTEIRNWIKRVPGG
jgi:hypothetical protein